MGGRGPGIFLPYGLAVCVATAAAALAISGWSAVAVLAAGLAAALLVGELMVARVPAGKARRLFVERRRAEEALRASEDRLRLALDAGGMGAYDWNVGTGELLWSEQLERLHGLAPGTFGRTFEAALSRVHPDDRELFRLAVADALEAGTENQIEYRTVWPDGSIHWLVSKGEVLRDAMGRALRLTGVVMDVDGRKRLEASRAELLARETVARAAAEDAGRRAAFFAEATAILSSSLDHETTLGRLVRLAVPSIADGCVVHVAETDGTLRGVAVAYADPAREKTARELARRYPPRPDDPSGASRVVRTGHVELVPEITDEMLQDSARDAEHLAILRGLGMRSWACVPLQARGETLGAITFVSTTPARRLGPADVAFTEELGRRAALAVDNAQLYHAAQAANRVKDEFLATLSDELRTPLNAILGWTQLLRGGKLDQARVARALGAIERNAKLQVQLIEDLLDVSRLITGKLCLESTPVDLVTVVDAAVDSVRESAAAKGVALETQLDAPGPLAGDGARLQQVVWNLLSNAIKFTPRNGRVTIRLERTGAEAELRVSDTGRGIASEFLPHIFDCFRQADSSSTRIHGGLGLGLAIVRHLVELHGGNVQAESAGVNEGATFTVRLPLSALAAGDGASAGSRPEDLPSLRGFSILVVDDALDARESLAMLLEECGARVTAVASAPEALEAFASARPDVLVSDLAMPGLDGYALVARLRALEADDARPVPALALSAYARTEDRERALAAGFQAHVAKPVEPIEIASAVARLAGASDPARPRI